MPALRKWRRLLATAGVVVLAATAGVYFGIIRPAGLCADYQVHLKHRVPDLRSVALEHAQKYDGHVYALYTNGLFYEITMPSGARDDLESEPLVGTLVGEEQHGPHQLGWPGGPAYSLDGHKVGYPPPPLRVGEEKRGLRPCPAGGPADAPPLPPVPSP